MNIIRYLVESIGHVSTPDSLWHLNWLGLVLRIVKKYILKCFNTFLQDWGRTEGGRANDAKNARRTSTTTIVAVRHGEQHWHRQQDVRANKINFRHAHERKMNLKCEIILVFAINRASFKTSSVVKSCISENC